MDYFYPQLIEEKGFLKILVTPVVKATYKSEVLSFANLRTYTTWKDNNDTNKWSIKYYKGLGISSAKEAQEYFINLTKNTIDIIDTQKGGNLDILLAFEKKKLIKEKNG